LPTTSEENQNIDMMDVESAVGQMKKKINLQVMMK
jgi:hypothetical protein